jgi:hypothetical protein
VDHCDPQNFKFLTRLPAIRADDCIAAAIRSLPEAIARRLTRSVEFPRSLCQPLCLSQDCDLVFDGEESFPDGMSPLPSFAFRDGSAMDSFTTEEHHELVSIFVPFLNDLAGGTLTLFFELLLRLANES